MTVCTRPDTLSAIQRKPLTIARSGIQIVDSVDNAFPLLGFFYRGEFGRLPRYMTDYDDNCYGGDLIPTGKGLSPGSESCKYAVASVSPHPRVPAFRNTIVVYMSRGYSDTETPVRHETLIGQRMAQVMKEFRFRECAIFGFYNETYQMIQNFISGFLLGYNSRSNSKELVGTLKTVLLVAPQIGRSRLLKAENSLSSKYIAASGVDLARQLGDIPPNIATTVTVANFIKSCAAEFKMKVTEIDENGMIMMGMGGLYSVGKGSSSPPRFLIMTYTPTNSYNEDNSIVIIGKGVCFDSGGYCLKKDYKSMSKMGYDKCGVATVLGVAEVVAEMRPTHIQIHFLFGLVENMVSKDSYRPGDVITMYNKKDVLVNNTDAEGRLILADMISYANINLKTPSGFKPAVISTVATLTGGIITALGKSCAGCFSTNDELTSCWLKSAASGGELVHNMPLIMEYLPQLMTKRGVLCNIAKDPESGAQSIIAALFLTMFTDDTPFLHLDIAGTATDEDGYATGYGVTSYAVFIEECDKLASTNTLRSTFKPAPLVTNEIIDDKE